MRRATYVGQKIIHITVILMMISVTCPEALMGLSAMVFYIAK